jgi:hypothetical protein
VASAPAGQDDKHHAGGEANGAAANGGWHDGTPSGATRRA